MDEQRETLIKQFEEKTKKTNVIFTILTSSNSLTHQNFFKTNNNNNHNKNNKMKVIYLLIHIIKLLVP